MVIISSLFTCCASKPLRILSFSCWVFLIFIGTFIIFLYSRFAELCNLWSVGADLRHSSAISITYTLFLLFSCCFFYSLCVSFIISIRLGILWWGGDVVQSPVSREQFEYKCQTESHCLSLYILVTHVLQIWALGDLWYLSWCMYHAFCRWMGIWNNNQLTASMTCLPDEKGLFRILDIVGMGTHWISWFLFSVRFGISGTEGIENDYFFKCNH